MDRKRSDFGTLAACLGALVNRLFGRACQLDGMAENTKADLAARLGVVEEDLIPRRKAAEMLGLDEDTLRTHANEHVGFFRLSDSRTARALYPKPWVEDYKRWRAAGRQTRFHGKMGPQPWPAQRQITVAAAILMIERWKYRELHERCEAVCGRSMPVAELLERHRAEAAILFNREGERRSADEPDLFDALVGKAKEVVQPAGSCVHPERLVRLMQTVWEQVLETERGWLASMKG